MGDTPAELLGATLRTLRSGGSFATRRTAPTRDLAIEVKGVGPLQLPVSAAQARALRPLARPARHGQGERTVLDPGVRDTWEVPRSRVTIDARRWNRTLRPLLDAVRDDLGLAPSSSLRAELHSMLLYEPGQFFAPHQDSEKNDRMIGSLVVMLPSRSTGGELVVEHLGESVRYQGSASALTFVAFYSDTRHEVLPLEAGHRVVLTYNLMLAGDPAAASRDDTGVSATVADLLTRHFERVPPPRWKGDRLGLAPPDRLVFLLDHQYSERGLGWAQLKGDDAARADALRRGAEAAGCEVVLAHAEVHETWDCYEDERRWGQRRRSRWYDDDRAGDRDVDDDLELGELLDSEVSVMSPGGASFQLDPTVTDIELSAATPSVELVAHDTEYTGYTGNEGNTMDRWYRRAAVVIWPRARAFAVRAKADPTRALHQILLAGADDPPRSDLVATLLRFWADGVHRGDQRELLAPALQLATELGDENATNRLLDPFSIEAVAPGDATALAALADLHGASWFDLRLAAWIDTRRWHTSGQLPGRVEWAATLPELVTGLHNAPHEIGPDSARALTGHVWTWLDPALRAAASDEKPSRREEWLDDLTEPLAAMLRATAITRDHARRDAIIEAVIGLGPTLIPMLVAVVEAGEHALEEPEDLGLGPLARHCADTLAIELAAPRRAEGDWSITGLIPHPGCDDCTHLVSFLTAPDQRQLTWPLAKPRRQHIHQRIDAAELPVTHRTVRQGSPHKLVLTKTDALFQREADRRHRASTLHRTVRRLLDNLGEHPRRV